MSPDGDKGNKKFKEEYEKSLRKFDGLVKKQEQLLRGKLNIANLTRCITIVTELSLNLTFVYHSNKGHKFQFSILVCLVYNIKFYLYRILKLNLE